MNLRAHDNRTCAAAFVVPSKMVRTAFVLATLSALAAFACHTWQGVKEDTHHAVQETGRGMEKAGKKLKGSDEKKPADPPANKTDAGAPSSDR